MSAAGSNAEQSNGFRNCGTGRLEVEAVAVNPTGIGGTGRLLVADELAERWQVPRAHVYRLARDGRLPTVTLGRYKRWRLDEVEAFERAGGVSE